MKMKETMKQNVQMLKDNFVSYLLLCGACASIAFVITDIEEVGHTEKEEQELIAELEENEDFEITTLEFEQE